MLAGTLISSDRVSLHWLAGQQASRTRMSPPLSLCRGHNRALQWELEVQTQVLQLAQCALYPGSKSSITLSTNNLCHLPHTLESEKLLKLPQKPVFPWIIKRSYTYRLTMRHRRTHTHACLILEWKLIRVVPGYQRLSYLWNIWRLECSDWLLKGLWQTHQVCNSYGKTMWEGSMKNSRSFSSNTNKLVICMC